MAGHLPKGLGVEGARRAVKIWLAVGAVEPQGSILQVPTHPWIAGQAGPGGAGTVRGLRNSTPPLGGNSAGACAGLVKVMATSSLQAPSGGSVTGDLVMMGPLQRPSLNRPILAAGGPGTTAGQVPCQILMDERVVQDFALILFAFPLFSFFQERERERKRLGRPLKSERTPAKRQCCIHPYNFAL